MFPCSGLRYNIKMNGSATSTSVQHNAGFLHTTILFIATLNKQRPRKIDSSVGEGRILFHTKLSQGRGRRDGIMLSLYLLAIHAF